MKKNFKSISLPSMLFTIGILSGVLNANSLIKTLNSSQVTALIGNNLSVVDNIEEDSKVIVTVDK